MMSLLQWICDRLQNLVIFFRLLLLHLFHRTNIILQISHRMFPSPQSFCQQFRSLRDRRPLALSFDPPPFHPWHILCIQMRECILTSLGFSVGTASPSSVRSVKALLVEKDLTGILAIGDPGAPATCDPDILACKDCLRIILN